MHCRFLSLARIATRKHNEMLSKLHSLGGLMHGRHVAVNSQKASKGLAFVAKGNIARWRSTMIVATAEMKHPVSDA